MISKQNLWFLTLFSLILILGVYYVTMPNDLLEKIEIKSEEKKEPVVKEIKEESILTAMRINLEEERQETINVLQEQLTSEKLTTKEKNNVYEELKYLNEIQGKEEQLEKKIKKELDLDCFIKMNNNGADEADVVCVSNEHNSTIANKIMRIIQKDTKTKINTTVKFQKNNG